MVVHAYDMSTWEVETGESESQGYPQLQSQFEVSLGYMQLCWIKMKERTKEKRKEGGRKEG